MIIVIAPVLVMIIGLLMFVLSTNPKLSEVGRIMFGCGLFVAILRPDALKLVGS